MNLFKEPAFSLPFSTEIILVFDTEGLCLFLQSFILNARDSNGGNAWSPKLFVLKSQVWCIKEVQFLLSLPTPPPPFFFFDPVTIPVWERGFCFKKLDHFCEEFAQQRECVCKYLKLLCSFRPFSCPPPGTFLKR